MTEPDPEPEVDRLLDLADGLPPGPARLAALEQAVGVADAAADVALGYRARHALMDAEFNRGDLLLVHFGWCLAQFDRHPGRFDEYRLLWKYKWACGRALAFPDIPWHRVEALTADMADRFDRYGAGRRAVWDQRLAMAVHRGDKAAAADAYRSFRRTPRDHLSNCPACEADDAVDYAVFRGRWAAAVAAAGPILAGRLTCRTVPQRTYAVLLEPLVRLGRLADAADGHRAGLATHRRTPPALTTVARHVLFLALTDNLAGAVGLVGDHLGEAVGGPDPGDRFRFWRAVGFVADRLARAASPAVRLPFPPGHPLHAADGAVDVGRLAAWAAAEAGQLADRFDARNGTPAHRTHLARTSRLHRRVTPFPV